MFRLQRRKYGLATRKNQYDMASKFTNFHTNILLTSDWINACFHGLYGHNRHYGKCKKQAKKPITTVKSGFLSIFGILPPKRKALGSNPDRCATGNGPSEYRNSLQWVAIFLLPERKYPFRQYLPRRGIHRSSSTKSHGCASREKTFARSSFVFFSFAYLQTFCGYALSARFVKSRQFKFGRLLHVAMDFAAVIPPDSPGGDFSPRSFLPLVPQKRLLPSAKGL